MKKKDYYIYFLIDPRTDTPFYVGKGIGDRAESHLEEVESEMPKNLHIRSIRNEGLEPYVRRFIWNLDEPTAFTVETALINSLDGLTNQVQGQDLSNVRKKTDFPEWIEKYPGIDFAMETNRIDKLDAEHEERSYFQSELHAYNAIGSLQKGTRPDYCEHTKTGIKMWTGNTRDPNWKNEYDPATGDYYIGVEEVLEKHGTWEEMVRVHQETKTLNKNIALCRIDTKYSELGTEVEVGKIDGHQKRIGAKVIAFPFYDPAKSRVRA